MGFFLEPYARSVRARQKQSPKFYFFDCGVARALSNEINQTLLPQTFSYGKIFEQMVICECMRLNQYLEKNWKFSYLRTGAGLKIDLIIEKSKKEIILVEIKATQNCHEDHLSSLKKLGDLFINSTKYLLCLDEMTRKISDIKIINWRQGLLEIFYKC